MKKAIVTGATGFIGKFLVRELVNQNVEVIAVVRQGTKNLNTINTLPVKIVECNIADYHMLPDIIADRDIDVVFHIAWQAMDVFVLPSLWEGLPFTLVEAQAAGLPCVISDVISDESIVTDLIRKESLKQSAEVWAKKTLDVYDEITRKDTAELVKAAGFDIETSAQWLQEFYLKRYWDETRKNG